MGSFYRPMAWPHRPTGEPVVDLDGAFNAAGSGERMPLPNGRLAASRLTARMSLPIMSLAIVPPRRASPVSPHGKDGAASESLSFGTDR